MIIVHVTHFLNEAGQAYFPDWLSHLHNWAKSDEHDQLISKLTPYVQKKWQSQVFEAGKLHTHNTLNPTLSALELGHGESSNN